MHTCHLRHTYDIVQSRTSSSFYFFSFSLSLSFSYACVFYCHWKSFQTRIYIANAHTNIVTSTYVPIIFYHLVLSNIYLAFFSVLPTIFLAFIVHISWQVKESRADRSPRRRIFSLFHDEKKLDWHWNARNIVFATLLSYSLPVFIIEFLWVESKREERRREKLNIRRWREAKQWVPPCVMAQHACARLSSTQRIMTWCWTIDNRARRRRRRRRRRASEKSVREKTCEVFVACPHYSKKPRREKRKRRRRRRGEKDEREERRCAQWLRE